MILNFPPFIQFLTLSLSHSITAHPGKMTNTEIDSDISEDESEDLGSVDLLALEESLNESGDFPERKKPREQDPGRIRSAEIKEVRDWTDRMTVELIRGKFRSVR